MKGSYPERGGKQRKRFSEAAARLARFPRGHGSEVMLRGEEPRRGGGHPKPFLQTPG